MSSSSGRGTRLLKDLIRSHEGPLTRELVRKPGRFGLGQVPTDQLPDSVATVVCGFCATGCGMKAHLRNGEAVGLSPEARYPVNRGMACPRTGALVGAPDGFADGLHIGDILFDD